MRTIRSFLKFLAIVIAIWIMVASFLPCGSGNGVARRIQLVNDATRLRGQVDAYGRLTRDFLIITRPQQMNLGPQVIPVQRLITVQFGDGGIQEVNENQPNPGE